jgi:hypothetical protein
VAIVIYQFAHGSNATHMVNRFNVGASIIQKYVDIVCVGEPRVVHDNG